MKKLISLTVCLCLAASLTSCFSAARLLTGEKDGKNESTVQSETTAPASETESRPETETETESETDGADDNALFAPGIRDGREYRNDYAGLHFLIPDNWFFLRDEQLEAMNRELQKTVADIYTEEDVGRSSIDMIASTFDSTRTINVAFEKGNVNKSAEDYVDGAIAQLKSSYVDLPARSAEKKTFDFLGESHVGIKSAVNSDEFVYYQYIIPIICENHFCIITITSVGEDAYDEIAAGFIKCE